MVKKFIFIFLLLTIITTSCSQKLDSDELKAMHQYCDQFVTENTCDLNSCEWGLKVKCAIPGKNCGAAYTGRSECFYNE